MAIEIERKFLVDQTLWQEVKPKEGISITQGYLLNTKEKTVRVRTKGERGFLTIKGASMSAIARSEFEYEIPFEEAVELLALYCPNRIEKIRYLFPFKGKIWEVDEFSLPHPDLILAELELSHEEEEFDLPLWVVKEVSDDPQYYNANMLQK